jgi:hypothetical protein
MKIIAFDKFKPGVTLDHLRPYLKEEVANVWRLWKAGIVRENYARADVGGVVIVFECVDAVEAKRYVADFPLSRANLIEWEFIACEAPLPLEFLFDQTVDVAANTTERLGGRDRCFSHEASERRLTPYSFRRPL